MIDYLYKTQPFEHQHKVFMESRDREYYALLMEQGTGKSKVTIDTGAWLYSQGRIDAIVVVAPNGVHRNWVINEIPTHCPEYTNFMAAWYSSQPTKKEEQCLTRTLKHEGGLRCFAINIEALTTAKGQKFLEKILLSFRCLLAIDESSTIKNPKAIRTKILLKLSVHASFKRILTGTPITQGPLDLFTQFMFLDPHILHTQSYYAFRSRYAELRQMTVGGRTFMNVVGYYNLDDLQAKIAPHSCRVTKQECLDLPEKLYSKRYVALSDSQKKLYQQLKKDVIAEFNGKVMSAPLALTKLLRLQQIVGGYFVPDSAIELGSEAIENAQDINGPNGHLYAKSAPEPIDVVNPRVESLMELLEETNGKVIIWARFRSEIRAIRERIAETFGEDSVVEYHGGISNNDRSSNIERFQSENTCRFFIGHVQAGGKGLTLHAATTVIYFSNDFSLENRLQSEDRAHRIGQKHNVTYIDFVAIGTLDEKIVSTLRAKKNVADLITGDEPMEEWI